MCPTKHKCVYNHCCFAITYRGVGSGGPIAPPFFKDKEQNLQLTDVEQAPQILQAWLYLDSSRCTSKLFPSTVRELHAYLQAHPLHLQLGLKSTITVVD